jgi:hypothetical protein
MWTFQPSAHLKFPPLFLNTIIMAPRSTRPHSRSSAPATRKRGESDPNEPPKKRKTRHSKGEVDEDDETKDGASVQVERKTGNAARRGKKAR